MQVNSQQKDIQPKELKCQLKGFEFTLVDESSRIFLLNSLGAIIVTLLPRKPLKIINEIEYLFKIYVLTQARENEFFFNLIIRSWVMKAENKETFDGWIKNIRKAYRPRWVDKSATQCWLCERLFTLCWRQHHCRSCGVVI